MPKQHLQITLSCRVPREVSRRRLRAYITEAIEFWGGQYSGGDADTPADPLFYGVTDVKITNVNVIAKEAK